MLPVVSTIQPCLFDGGSLRADLARRVAWPTESAVAARSATLRAYLDAEIGPALERLGFAVSVHDNPVSGAPPLLVGVRDEDPSLPTVLFYGHGDVVTGLEGAWRDHRDPWTLDDTGDRWYGRGTADNKGQHSVLLAALAALHTARAGSLGFNARWLFEMGEEVGSPGLHEFCARSRDLLAADVLIASDGPRLAADRPTVFLGSRGIAEVDLELRLRDGAHHSGNWGGLLRNPGTILAGAIASLVDAHGVIRVASLRPPPIPDSVRRCLAPLQVGGGPDDPTIDDGWGEPGLTPAERVFGWNTLELLAFGCGDPERPVGAIPGVARATLQLRYVVGTDVSRFDQVIAEHLIEHGFDGIQVSEPRLAAATRVDPDDRWVRFAVDVIGDATGKEVAVLPNLGGTIPNDAFSEVLGMPTVWVPHSYPGCSQHAPNEHLLPAVAREGLLATTALLWELGELSMA
ncbi:MAG TPA: hypothetical protein DCR14_02260 [Acidimicrobiaceae bacterium]|nr:hypothetical protein [Acidimicrobiaceae bacterium]